MHTGTVRTGAEKIKDQKKFVFNPNRLRIAIVGLRDKKYNVFND